MYYVSRCSVSIPLMWRNLSVQPLTKSKRIKVYNISHVLFLHCLFSFCWSLSRFLSLHTHLRNKKNLRQLLNKATNKLHEVLTFYYFFFLPLSVYTFAVDSIAGFRRYLVLPLFVLIVYIEILSGSFKILHLYLRTFPIMHIFFWIFRCFNILCTVSYWLVSCKVSEFDSNCTTEGQIVFLP